MPFTIHIEDDFISYYELLKIIDECEKREDYPKVYWHNNTGKPVLYVPIFDNVDNSLSGYCLKNKNQESEDIRYWLSECMLEGEMFDKCLEVKKKVERSEINKQISQLQSEIDLIGNEINKYHGMIHSMRDRNNYMKQQLKQLMKMVGD